MGTELDYNSSNNLQHMASYDMTVVDMCPGVLVVEYWVGFGDAGGNMGGCPKEWAARIESKLSVIYIWGPSEFCSLDIG